MTEEYKFQKLQVYQLALAYVDAVYVLSSQLPERERFNLSSQIERASTSIVLNIAEGSTGQSDAEQNRFLGLALRSYLETIACLDLITHLTQNVPQVPVIQARFCPNLRDGA
jgi:four helix bundle protein